MTIEHQMVVELFLLACVCSIPVMAGWAVLYLANFVFQETQAFWRDFWRAYYYRRGK